MHETALLAASTSYPLLNAFWTMLYLFIWILWIFLLIRIIMDIFRSEDLGGWGKAGWLIFIIILPFLGVFVYVIARGASMHRRDARQAQATDQAFRSYVQEAAAPAASSADEIAKLATLREQGVLTDAEFAAQKEKILARAG
jgi:Short C-terminal domain/Phospholipase_D-nuclease N-terminal